MMASRYPTDPFTPEAARRWREVPQWAQEKTLENVWCGQCLGAVTIILETAKMVEDNLILQDKCKGCGGNAWRVGEPESE